MDTVKDWIESETKKLSKKFGASGSKVSSLLEGIAKYATDGDLDLDIESFYYPPTLPGLERSYKQLGVEETHRLFSLFGYEKLESMADTLTQFHWHFSPFLNAQSLVEWIGKFVEHFENTPTYVDAGYIDESESPTIQISKKEYEDLQGSSCIRTLIEDVLRSPLSFRLERTVVDFGSFKTFPKETLSTYVPNFEKVLFSEEAKRSLICFRGMALDYFSSLDLSNDPELFMAIAECLVETTNPELILGFSKFENFCRKFDIGRSTCLRSVIDLAVQIENERNLQVSQKLREFFTHDQIAQLVIDADSSLESGDVLLAFADKGIEKLTDLCKIAVDFDRQRIEQEALFLSKFKKVVQDRAKIPFNLNTKEIPVANGFTFNSDTKNLSSENYNVRLSGKIEIIFAALLKRMLEGQLPVSYKTFKDETGIEDIADYLKGNKWSGLLFKGSVSKAKESKALFLKDTENKCYSFVNC
jgi:hypothetical protein